MNLRDLKSVKERRKALETELHISLPNIGSYTFDEAVSSARHCENMIGAAQVPMGVAGPLLVHHSDGSKKRYFVPLATTEGALVASVNRGCKAITESGGALSQSHRAGASRAPVFRVKGLREGLAFERYLASHQKEIADVARTTSSHLSLLSYSVRAAGNYRYVRFSFDTQDAMGLNMVTIACDAIASYLREKTGATCVALSGNYCIDKKPAWVNYIHERGNPVYAEATIPFAVLRDVLKTTARNAHDVWLSKCMIGSALSGSLGFNAQFANVVAAVFLATGQDVAHVSEGSIGMTTTEVIPDEHDPGREALSVSVSLPDLLVGTVGGGTGLATQKEALTMLGCFGGDGGNNARRFSEIIGAAVLAGELSLLSSLSEGTLSRAHQRLARGKG